MGSTDSSDTVVDAIKKTPEQERHDSIWSSLLLFIQHCRVNFSREGDVAFNHFAINVTDEIVQLSCAIRMLAGEGMHDTCKRELRYLLELATKASLIAQKSNADGARFDEQLQANQSTLAKTDLNLLNAIEFRELQPDIRAAFLVDTKRLYGLLSSYAHTTHRQLSERKTRVRAGCTIGKEGEDELRDLNDYVARTYAAAIVLLSQALPQWVVGDFMVSMRRVQPQWYFVRSRHIAHIDEAFDYKHERQENLSELRELRSAQIDF